MSAVTRWFGCGGPKSMNVGLRFLWLDCLAPVISPHTVVSSPTSLADSAGSSTSEENGAPAARKTVRASALQDAVPCFPDHEQLTAIMLNEALPETDLALHLIEAERQSAHNGICP
jgi:hypothetical protein